MVVLDTASFAVDIGLIATPGTFVAPPPMMGAVLAVVGVTLMTVGSLFRKRKGRTRLYGA